MARDAELDRLKTAQDAAFERKQTAYATQQRAWERRVSAGNSMNRAYEAKQRAYAEQDRTWNYLQSVRSANGPRIESLNSQQEAAFNNMQRAFENASSAHDRRDGAMARSYADDGHRYKAESQGYVAERRRLVAEIRSAGDSHQASKPAFQRAKDDFDAAKRVFDDAKRDHERTQEQFKEAKAAFDAASKAFKGRLEKVRGENKRRTNDKRALAQKAGMPSQYLDAIWVSTDRDGNTNIYFGGVGKPNGPGHGHYTVNRNGKVTYKRDPFDPHGAHNFTEDRREGATLAMAQMAMNQWAKTQATPWGVQFEDGEFKVQVKAGYDQRYDCIVTDLLIHDKHNKKEHYHLVIDEHGRELFAEWRENRRSA